jgi:hypothetical protein
MAQGKRQVIGKRAAGPVSRIEDGPASLVPMAAANMLLRDATGAPDRPAQAERLRQSRPASRPGVGWDGPLLEDGDTGSSKPHVCRKTFSSVEKRPKIARPVENHFSMSAVENRF